MLLLGVASPAKLFPYMPQDAASADTSAKPV